MKYKLTIMHLITSDSTEEKPMKAERIIKNILEKSKTKKYEKMKDDLNKADKKTSEEAVSVDQSNIPTENKTEITKTDADVVTSLPTTEEVDTKEPQETPKECTKDEEVDTPTTTNDQDSEELYIKKTD